MIKVTDIEPRATYRTTLETPVGVIGIEGDEVALDRIDLPGSRAPGGGEYEEPLDGSQARTVLAPVIDQLEQYFGRERTEFDLTVRVRGTTFQRRVWLALSGIPYGTTTTYGQLARDIRKPGASRAVGQANGANPLPIVLGCHRVLATGGRIGGYGGGLDMKRALLELEGAAWNE